VTLLLWGAALAGALVEALDAELGRAMAGLQLPDQPRPYLVAYEVLDGDVVTTRASFGATTSFEHEPYRNLRAEVRVGDYELDNSNFEGEMGEGQGVVSRALPTEDVVVALRREVWLATDQAYKGATEQLASKLSAREGQDQEHPPDLTLAPALQTDPMDAPSVDGERARRLAADLSGLLAGIGGVEGSDALVREWQGVRLVRTSEGTRAWLPTGFAVVRAQAVARAADGTRVRDARWWVARDSAALPAWDDMRAEVEDMGAWLQALANAPVEEDYLGPVAFEPAAAVELFRQLLAPQVCGTPPVERSADSFFAGGEDPPTARLGRRVLPAGWEVVDDPTAWPREAGSYAHDFEAVAARRVHVVRDGIVRDLLMSRIPRRDLAGSNGHGRSLGNDRREAMATAVEVAPRRERSDSALRRKALALAREAGVAYALVVRRLVPLELVEALEVKFSGDTPLAGLTSPLEAYRLYPDGREEPVRSAQFVGVDYRALRDIAAAGRLGPPVGLMDGAAGRRRFQVGDVGGLAASWRVPAVVVAEMELHGTPGGEPRVLVPPGAGDRYDDQRVTPAGTTAAREKR
jgi:hypothetical protein